MGYGITYRDLSFILTFVYFGMWVFVNSAFGYNGCPKPADPLGGGNFADRKDFYDVTDAVIYGCPTQRYLFGNIRRTCLANGSWSGSLPYCVKSRSGIQLQERSNEASQFFDGNTETCLHINNGRSRSIYINIEGNHKRIVVKIVSRGYHNGFRVFYAPNNYPDSHRSFSKTLENYYDGDKLSWFVFSYSSSEILTNPRIGIAVDICKARFSCKVCEVIIFTDIIAACRQLEPENRHTFITFDKQPPNHNSDFEYGSAATFSCREGYYLVGRKTRHCSDNSRWTGINSLCKAIVCSGKPPTIQNGFWLGWKVGETYYFNHSLVGVCEDGYSFYDKSPISTCTSQGKWSVEPSGLHCQKVVCSETPPELKNANWSSWENGKTYSINSSIEAVCKYGYLNHDQPIIVTCNAIGTWSPQFLQDSCQEQSTNSLRRTIITTIAVIGLFLVLICLGICIFWTRRGINKRLQKRAHQADILLENPIYNSSSPSIQGEDFLTPIYLQPQMNLKDSNKQCSDISNEEITDTAGMVSNETYYIECPIAKAIHEYNTSVYEEVTKDEHNKPTKTSQPISERGMQEIVVENEIYGTE